MGWARGETYLGSLFRTPTKAYHSSSAFLVIWHNTTRLYSYSLENNGNYLYTCNQVNIIASVKRIQGTRLPCISCLGNSLYTHFFNMASKRRTSSDDLVGSAPDLEILGDQVTLHPSGYVEPTEREDGKEQALMENSGRFRKAPLE